MSVKSYALWIVLLLNVGLTAWKAATRLSYFVLFNTPDVHSEWTEDDSSAYTYTYIGDDYPLYYPTGPLDDVAMTLHTTSRFELNASSPTADAEWGLLASMPHGYGRTRLGTQWRLFVITVYHQMHCLRKTEVALLNRDDPISNYHHVLHCLNYLRQWFLCEANESLEEGDFLEKDWENDRIGDTLVCKDWERVYDVLDEQYDDWLKWRDEWN